MYWFYYDVFLCLKTLFMQQKCSIFNVESGGKFDVTGGGGNKN